SHRRRVLHREVRPDPGSAGGAGQPQRRAAHRLGHALVRPGPGRLESPAHRAMTTGRLLLALRGNEGFAVRLARELQAECAVVEARRFPDGESYVRLPLDPAGRVVDLVCTLAQPDDVFLRLVFAADAARQLGATEVNLVAPYLAYMRQDCRFKPGESISSLTFARLLSATFDRLVTVDPHLHRHPTLAALYTRRADTLQSAPLLADWIAANVANPLIIGPDEESEQWAGAIAGRIKAPHAVLRKGRSGD